MRCFAVVRSDHSSTNCSSRGRTCSSTGRGRLRFRGSGSGVAR